MSAVTVFLFFALAAGLFAVLSLGLGLRSSHDRYREKFLLRANRVLPDFFVFIKAERLFAANSLAVLCLTLAAFLLTRSVAVSLITALIAGALPSLIVIVMRRKRRSKLAEQFPEFASLLAGALRSGNSFQLALQSIASDLTEPLRQEVTLLLREQKLGIPVEESLTSLVKRIDLEDYVLFIAAVKISRQSGGNLAETLETMAGSSRRKLALESKIHSLTAQGRLQGWVMVGLPFALALLLSQIEPRAMAPLFSTWYGWVVIAVVIGLQAAGLWFIQRIISIDI